MNKKKLGTNYRLGAFGNTWATGSKGECTTDRQIQIPSLYDDDDDDDDNDDDDLRRWR